ncbi:ATP-binding protein [Candidatus Woesearchaeota archaeon]|nr:ATP-binding protein [Candidatus Woesearchaeota archaeon]
MESKELAIRRKYYLDLLDSNTNSIKKGAGKHIVLLGSRKCGKTSIVKEHLKNAKDVVPVYIDFGKISLNPENFSIELIGNVVFYYLKKPIHDYKKFLLLGHLIKIENELKSKNAFSLIKAIENELLKIKPDQRLMAESAFKFAEALGRDSNKKLLIVFDNFENILDLNNYSKIKDILSLINFDALNVCYVATSSAIKESLSSLKKFQCYEIKNLERDDAIGLIEGIVGKNDKAGNEIFELSSGHPFVATLISKRYNELKDAKKAFLIELLQKNNSIYNYCNESLNYYYNRARGQTLLKTILKVVANEELRLSEIARRIYRSAPVTKSILERLVDVDVICKKDKRYYFNDNVLRLWLKLTSHGYEFDEAPDDKTLNEIEKEL